jgi:hypothetical protein
MPENPPFGHLKRTGEGTRVEVVAPIWCRRGHRLEPGKVTVSHHFCACAHARDGGHMTWKCDLDGELMVGDGHTDDSLLRS